MKELDLVSLKLFIGICESGNIARVAAQHNVVASAVSKRLLRLEEDIGVALIDRTQRGLVPTSAGETMLEHARAMLMHSERALRDMEGFRSGVRGKVKLLATVSSVAEHLPLDIAAFLAEPAHTAIRVDIEETLNSEMAQALHAGLASVGVCWGAADLGGLQRRPYRTDHLAMVVHPSHPLARRKRCAFVDTLEFEHVGLPARTAGHAMLAGAAAQAGRRIAYRALLSTFDAVLKVVAANLGIAVAPVEIAAAYARAAGLCLVPLTDSWATRQLVIVYVDHGRLPSPARLLVDFLAARAAK